MTTKYYCDICGKPTKNNDNLNVEELEDKFDICDGCLKTKTTSQMLKALYKKRIGDSWVNTYITEEVQK